MLWQSRCSRQETFDSRCSRATAFYPLDFAITGSPVSDILRTTITSGVACVVDRHLMPRPLLRTSVLLPPASAALGLAFAAIHVRPPAGDVARLCIAVAAGLLLVNLFAWAARDGARFGREQRLLAFVGFAAVAMGVYFARQGIAEREFDTIVDQQRQQLADSAADLSREIIAYVNGRASSAPPPPQSPATWEHDEARWAEFDAETVTGYAPRFARRVATTRAALTLRNLRDRDLDVLYQQPRNAFEIRMIGERLGVLAERLRRSIAPTK
jgi:hypothetical protein